MRWLFLHVCLSLSLVCWPPSPHPHLCFSPFLSPPSFLFWTLKSYTVLGTTLDGMGNGFCPQNIFLVDADGVWTQGLFHTRYLCHWSVSPPWIKKKEKFKDWLGQLVKPGFKSVQQHKWPWMCNSTTSTSRTAGIVNPSLRPGPWRISKERNTLWSWLRRSECWRVDFWKVCSEWRGPIWVKRTGHHHTASESCKEPNASLGSPGTFMPPPVTAGFTGKDFQYFRIPRATLLPHDALRTTATAFQRVPAAHPIQP